MKFFVPLDFCQGKCNDPYSSIGSVYGPYKDDRAVEEAIVRLWPEDKKRQFLVLDGQIVKIGNIKPSANEKSEHEKRAPGNIDNCIKNDEQYMRKNCGSTILESKDDASHPSEEDDWRWLK